MKAKFSVERIIQLIQEKQCFECFSEDADFYIKIEEYKPGVCFAIHNGHQMRESLKKKSLLSNYERWYEEDPHTLDFISSMPIVVSANLSRYECDLNRSEEDCIAEILWEKKLWKQKLSKAEKERSYQKHRAFYRIVDALFRMLEKEFEYVLAFDIHSYNYKRIKRKTPVFNIGTENINRDLFKKTVDLWKRMLGEITLVNIPITVKENDVFMGRGYLLKHISQNFPKSLVLATEIKKIYCNEETGEHFPQIIDSLSEQLKEAMVETSGFFIENHSNYKMKEYKQLLSSDIDASILSIDKKLYQLTKDFEILNYINPVNIEAAKRDFFKSKFTANPNFVYKPLNINPHEFKRSLYSINVEKIHDISWRILYQDIISSYADKIDIIHSIGTDKFKYNSLLYFGEPDETDVKNAEYILHCATSHEKKANELGAHEALLYIKKTIESYGFPCKVEVSKHTTSKVLALSSKKTIRIRKDARFNKAYLKALAEHEVGVHMLTTANASNQKLKAFLLGTPVNTHTQEGLALLAEYLSGAMDMQRLQILALRVLSINYMLKGNDFKQCFHFLMDMKKIDEHQAFYMAARVFRGGGFTKDYLYLRGFKDIYHQWNNNLKLDNLLIGKIGIDYLDTINEMVERKQIKAPQYITHSFQKPKEADPIIAYVIKGLL
jgi:uncharacterized protein (TIGR02421 family)